MKKNREVLTMLKEAAILFGITLIAGLLLGFVYELTKEPIRIQKEKAIAAACQKVFTQADDFKATEYFPTVQLKTELKERGVEIGTVFEASSQGNLLGYVVESTSGEGYGGDIVLYVGVTVDGKLNDISILTISETPGLGMLAEKVLVPQYHEKKVEQFTYTKTGSTSDSEIDAISGATITTEAVNHAVNAALKVVGELVQGGAMDE
ncbi:MAG: RnfABCDGE type electron transport complex subunit G [Lachnospiraceae bacterium]|nr:RnfABCDGE type electron transport complex subunit G [Lachnospiraceae bacterium]